MMKSFACLCMIALLACDAPRTAQAGPPAIPPTDVVPDDSAPSMPVLLRRFQAVTPGRPMRLSGASGSREELVSSFLAALERGDTAALAAMRVTPAEFAYLFFPESVYMRAPYELDPGVVWMQIDAGSRAGLRRAVQHFSGKPLGDVGLLCQPPRPQGTIQLHGCDVRRIVAPGDTVRDRMFGAILEREGSFKFLSLENRL